jgi:hypothetical protein
MSDAMLDDLLQPGPVPPVRPIRFLDEPDKGLVATPDGVDPGTVMLTCANCGAAMDERKCKLICRCGYFLSCSDYY